MQLSSRTPTPICVMSPACTVNSTAFPTPTSADTSFGSEMVNEDVDPLSTTVPCVHFASEAKATSNALRLSAAFLWNSTSSSKARFWLASVALDPTSFVGGTTVREFGLPHGSVVSVLGVNV